MLKVVHLTRSYWPNVGGVETHLFHLIPELTKDNIKQAIITEQTNLPIPDQEKNSKILVKRIATLNHQSSWKYKLLIWLGIAKNFNLLFDADVIHIHDVFWWLLPFWLILKMAGKRMYITFHGYEGDDKPSAKQIFWHRFAGNLTAGNICVGDFHQKWYGVKPTYVTYGAVSHPIGRQQLSKSFQLIHVGRLAHDNGILEYLQAIKILSGQGISVHLDSYGNGPLLQTCQNYVKKHKLNVTFHGWIQPSEIYYQKYNLAFVSRYLAILESLAAGVPVIAHYNNQIKHDYLQLSPFAKWITIESEPRRIADQVKHCHSLSPVAQRWALDQTWSKMAEIYLKLWQIKV
jgi:glycosyltransferase involved in cell wall biosynthesis